MGNNNDKIIAVSNLTPGDYEVLLRLSHRRFRLCNVGKRRRASDPFDVWVEGNVTVAELNELLLSSADYPGSIRVREVL